MAPSVHHVHVGTRVTGHGWQVGGVGGLAVLDWAVAATNCCQCEWCLAFPRKTALSSSPPPTPTGRWKHSSY